MRVTSNLPVSEEDLVRGFLFRYKWKGQWITLEFMALRGDKVQCTPPKTYMRHRYIKLEDVLAKGRKLEP